MKFCTKCGAQNQDESSFCTKCGTPLLSNNMFHKPSKKKTLTIAVITVSVIAIFSIILFGYVICLNHDWSEATCLEPAKCQKCEKYKDNVLGNHEWTEATCTTPKICLWCGLEVGEPLGHNWSDGSCTESQTCLTCGEIGTKASGHVEGDWILVQEATLVDVGIEKLYCSVCGEFLDSRGTERKNPKVSGKSFNFTDEEFIDWINNKSSASVDSTELGLSGTSDMNTSYLVTMSDGDNGVFILNHGDNGKNGNICGIMAYFDDSNNSGALIAWIGEKIDSDFSSDDAFLKFAYGKSYTSDDMTAMELELEDDFPVYVLAPTAFFEDILS